MHIVVCVKQVLDPEIPPSDFKLDPGGRKPLAENVPLVISIFDENALEVALQLREKERESKITALSLGPRSSEDALRKALAMGADEAILLLKEEDDWLDPLRTAYILASGIQRIRPFDLVLCGREAADWNFGQVGFILAEMLHIPCVSFVTSVNREGNLLRMHRRFGDVEEIVEVFPPALAVITNDEKNVPRLPKARNVMLAARKEIPLWAVADLEPQRAKSCVELDGLFIPTREGSCEIISGDDIEEKVSTLVEKILALRVL
jgi:electron transfer flavoprotein beta subunit